DDKWIGKQIRKLGLLTDKIQSRKSNFYKKRAIIYNRATLSRLFNLFSLEMPIGFDVRNVRNDLSSNEINTLGCEQENLKSELQNLDVRKLNDCKETTLQDREHCEQENRIDLQESKEIRSKAKASSIKASKLVALDTETERFNPKGGVTEKTAKMVGLSLSYDGEQADYETDPKAWPLLVPEPEQTVIFHNAKFDLGVLNRANLPIPKYFEDTLIAAHLLDENSEHGLKSLAKNLLGIDQPLTFEEADKMRFLDPEVFSEYARNDARFTFKLWQKFEPELKQQNLDQVYKMEKALVPIVIKMENVGMLLDTPMLTSLADMINKEIKLIQAEIYEHAGCKFDLNSPAKVATILYDKLNVPSNKATNKGQRSTSKEALDLIRGYHPSIDAILRYREIDKLANTFINVLPTFADEQRRIHPSFKPLGAKTGRFSCADPNVQQLPASSELGKKLRTAFIAGQGRKLVVADYSQMELRVLAHYSQDPLLLEAYCSEQEKDLHTLTASKMFRKPEVEVSKQERTIAKKINFGIAYGITPNGLFNSLRPSGINVSEKDCEDFIKNYFSSYPKIGEFLAN
ncbi:MAG: DNA polymerase I, partial [bacterium]